MMKFDGLTAFVAVAETGSISAAAQRLGVARSVVSERLADLEGSVAASLVQRTTRRVALTEDGEHFLVRARTIVDEMTSAAAELAERRGTLAGPLRLSGPVSFGTLHLGPALYSFMQAHPLIEVTLDLDDRLVDIAAAGYDAVIRHGPIRDKGLVARHLASSRRVLVAAPAHLAASGTPTDLASLERCRGILYSNREPDWRFPSPHGDRVVRPHAPLRVNNGLVMRGAALAGLGIALLPTFFVASELASGALVAIDVGAEAEGAAIYLAHPPNRRPSAKIAALTDWLRRAFATSFGPPACGSETTM